MAIYLATKLEAFCTESKTDYDMYDHLYVNEDKRYYILEIAERDYANYILDIDYGREEQAYYVSRTVFDFILKGLEKEGFKLKRIVFE